MTKTIIIGALLIALAGTARASGNGSGSIDFCQRHDCFELCPSVPEPVDITCVEALPCVPCPDVVCPTSECGDTICVCGAVTCPAPKPAVYEVCKVNRKGQLVCPRRKGKLPRRVFVPSAQLN